MSHTGAHPIVNPTSVRVEVDIVDTSPDLSEGSVAITSVGTSSVLLHAGSTATDLVVLSDADSSARIELRDKGGRHILGFEATFKGSLDGSMETIGVEVRPALSLVQDPPPHEWWVTAEAVADRSSTTLTLKLSQRRPTDPHVRIPSGSSAIEVPKFEIETEATHG